MQAAIDRTLRRTAVTAGGCWEWQGPKRPDGYVRVRVSPERLAYAHRFVYEALVGPVPAGLELDHLCRNRACVNPAHLEPVTHRENSRRSSAWDKQRAVTACPQGHPYDEQNTYITKRGNRCCRACRNRARDARSRKDV